MSRFNRCCATGWRTRQHYRRLAPGRIVFARALAVLLLFSSSGVSQSLLRIQLLEGEGVVNTAGSRSDRPIAVQLTDETGRPLEGVAVSFRMPEEGPGGSFEGGMKTEIAITTAEGRAAVHGIRWNRVSGPFQIRITAAKGESRAGAICSQYISDTPAAKGPGSAARKSRTKWIAIVAIAAGGAAAAGMAATRGGSSSTQTTAPGTQPVQIGLPTISVGRP